MVDKRRCACVCALIQFNTMQCRIDGYWFYLNFQATDANARSLGRPSIQRQQNTVKLKVLWHKMVMSAIQDVKFTMKFMFGFVLKVSHMIVFQISTSKSMTTTILTYSEVIIFRIRFVAKKINPFY